MPRRPRSQEKQTRGGGGQSYRMSNSKMEAEETSVLPELGPVVLPELPEELRGPLSALGGSTVQDVDQRDVEDEEEEEVEEQEFPDHWEWRSRLRKTLYYGGCSEADLPSTERFSLPLTEVCVEEFEGAAAECAKEADTFVAEDPEEKDEDEDDEEEQQEETDEDLPVRPKRSRSSRRRPLRRRRATLDRLDVSRTAELSRSTQASPASLVVALLYLERLRATNPSYVGGGVSSPDLFLVSLMVASKFLHDDGEDEEVFNDEWAEAAGMEASELNRKEIEFLEAIGWSVFVEPKEFERMRSRVETAVAKRQIARRRRMSRASSTSTSTNSSSFTTYTDLSVLARGVDPRKVWRLLAEYTLKVTAVCATAYAASVVTMLGTVCLLHSDASLASPGAIHRAISDAFLGGNKNHQHISTANATLTATAGSPKTHPASGPSSSSSSSAPLPDPSLELDSAEASATSFVLASLAAASAAAASTSQTSSNKNTAHVKSAKRLRSSSSGNGTSSSSSDDEGGGGGGGGEGDPPDLILDPVAPPEVMLLLNSSASASSGEELSFFRDPGGKGGGGENGGSGGGLNHHGTTVLLAPNGESGGGENGDGLMLQSTRILDAWRDHFGRYPSLWDLRPGEEEKEHWRMKDPADIKTCPFFSHGRWPLMAAAAAGIGGGAGGWSWYQHHHQGGFSQQQPAVVVGV